VGIRDRIMMANMSSKEQRKYEDEPNNKDRERKKQKREILDI
jgi:hypothetical protein